jgi:hypothetical protein
MIGQKGKGELGHTVEAGIAKKNTPVASFGFMIMQARAGEKGIYDWEERKRRAGPYSGGGNSKEEHAGGFFRIHDHAGACWGKGNL